jgi:hypothetical protein
MRDVVRIDLRGNPGYRSYCFQRGVGDVMLRAIKLRQFLSRWHETDDRWMQVINYPRSQP